MIEDPGKISERITRDDQGGPIMNVPKFFEKRQNRRRRLTGLLPGKITFENSDRSIHCQPVDTSPDGLGIVTNLVMKSGITVLLHHNEAVIPLTVLWGQPDFGKKDLYRYGLKSQDGSIDIEQLFVESGCLK